MTVEDDEEDDSVTGMTIIIACLAVLFLVPWIVIAAIQIRKRDRTLHIKKLRDYQ